MATPWDPEHANPQDTRNAELHTEQPPQKPCHLAPQLLSPAAWARVATWKQVGESPPPSQEPPLRCGGGRETNLRRAGTHRASQLLRPAPERGAPKTSVFVTTQTRAPKSHRPGPSNLRTRCTLTFPGVASMPGARSPPAGGSITGRLLTLQGQCLWWELYLHLGPVCVLGAGLLLGPGFCVSCLVLRLRWFTSASRVLRLGALVYVRTHLLRLCLVLNRSTWFTAGSQILRLCSWFYVRGSGLRLGPGFCGSHHLYVAWLWWSPGLPPWSPRAVCICILSKLCLRVWAPVSLNLGPNSPPL